MKTVRNDLTTQVTEVLASTPKARDSDQYLTLVIWATYYKSRLFKNEKGATSVQLADIMELPREDNVKRIRAKIQNEQHKYLPTSLEVAKQRRINEDEWRKWSQAS